MFGLPVIGGMPVNPINVVPPFTGSTEYRLLAKSVAYIFPSSLPRNPEEFGPQGEVGVEQSANPVLPTRDTAPVTGLTPIRSPVKARVKRDLSGPRTRPTPASSGGRPGPIGTNAPLRKSSAPNCKPFVTT